MENTVLIVEDEKDIRELMDYNLRKQGFRTETARDGKEALMKIRGGKAGLVILDLMLPEIDGMELCRLIKSDPDEAVRRLPVIMLTARSEEIDKVLGLEMGADDYITKPFSTRELVARVRAVMRRYEAVQGTDAAGGKIIKADDLAIDPDKYTVMKRGRHLDLSAMEFKLFLYLVRRPGRIMSRDFLLDAVWGNESYVEPRTVDVHIRRLREKIEDDPSDPRYILTKRGVGYYFAENKAGS
ncbi:MAG: response regulator transcription factor [Nitrospiraceae bacterium]|nr:response regulator transcription factor [Nitrospiraceae bacterium]